MSGPKVIRVVTREEMITRARGQLARLDAVVAEWRRSAETSGGLAAGALSELEERRKQLEDRLDRNQFLEFQRDFESEISFLRSDSEKRLKQAVEAAVQAKQRRRQEKATARSILEELGKVNVKAPDRIARQLRLLAEGEGVSAGVLEEAFALLSQVRAASSASEQQSELARALAQGERRITYSDWLANLKSPPSDDFSLRIDRHLAELRERNESSMADRFEEEAEKIRSETTLSRRNMLADSLLVELSAAVERSRRSGQQLARLRELAAELGMVGTPTAEALRKEITNAVAAGTTSVAERLSARAKLIIDENTAVHAAQQRRRVLLQGLAKLGYEVTEGMSTAWVRDGRIVMRKATNPKVGMEIGGGSDNEKLQVRAVAFGQDRREAAEERNVETAWCSDIDRLQEFVRENGGQVRIERATPIGVKPLKAIAEGEEERSVRSASTQSRTTTSR